MQRWVRACAASFVVRDRLLEWERARIPIRNRSLIVMLIDIESSAISPSFQDALVSTLDAEQKWLLGPWLMPRLSNYFSSRSKTILPRVIVQLIDLGEISSSRGSFFAFLQLDFLLCKRMTHESHRPERCRLHKSLEATPCEHESSSDELREPELTFQAP